MSEKTLYPWTIVSGPHCKPLIDNLMIYFAIAANGKEGGEVEDEVLLIDLGDGGGGGVGGGELIVNISEGLGVSEVSRAEEAIEGDDGLQYEKGHWVSALLDSQNLPRRKQMYKTRGLFVVPTVSFMEKLI